MQNHTGGNGESKEEEKQLISLTKQKDSITYQA